MPSATSIEIFAATLELNAKLNTTKIKANEVEIALVKKLNSFMIFYFLNFQKKMKVLIKFF